MVFLNVFDNYDNKYSISKMSKVEGCILLRLYGIRLIASSFDQTDNISDIFALHCEDCLLYLIIF